MIRTQLHKFQRMIFPITCGVPAKSMFDIIGGTNNLDIKLEDWEKDLGAGNYWELVALSSLVKRFSPKTIFEIGTGHGRSTLQIANNTSTEAVIHTLDISDQHPVGMIFIDKSQAQKVKRICSDSTTYDYSPFHKKVDFVLVDGAHDYKTVVADSEKAFDMVAPNGQILWDDFSPGWPGVVKALKELRGQKDLFRIPGTSYVYYQASSAPKN